MWRHTPDGLPVPNHYPHSFDPMARTISDSTLKGMFGWLRSWLLHLSRWSV